MIKGDNIRVHEKRRTNRLVRAVLSALLALVLLPVQAFAEPGSGTPPSSISGRFNLRAINPVVWDPNGSLHYGTITVDQGPDYGKHYDVVDFPGFFRCTSGSSYNAWDNSETRNPSPSTASWGTYTASYSSSDEKNGIVYYWVGHNQVLPAGISNWLSLQNLGNQTVGVRWSFVKGTINIEKSSANPGITNGNPCYSLAGAVYDVLNSGGTWVGSITTDAQGKGSLGNLELGTYRVRESKASPGYRLDPTTYTVTTTADAPVQTVSSTEPSAGDPLLVILQKVDAETGGSYGHGELPQGSAKLDGAEYTVRYYTGLYATVADAQAAVPTRTWIFGTDGDGYATLDTVIGGDPLYYDNGAPTIPFGTVTITETKAPVGYLLPQPGDSNYKVFLTRYVPDPFAPNGVRIEGDGNGVQQGNEPKHRERVMRGDIELIKFIKPHKPDSVELTGQDVPEAGAIFDFYASRDFGGTTPKGGATPAFSLTTDAAGKASTISSNIYLTQNNNGTYTITSRPAGAAGGLPYDSYLCVQRTGDPAYGFAPPAVFTVGANGTVQAKTFYDLPVAASIRVIKRDAETGAEIAWPATWQIWSEQTSSFVQMTVAGTKTDTFSSDAAGKLMLPEQLPYGDYRLHEVTAPGNQVTGYVLNLTDVLFSVDKDYSPSSPLVVEMTDAPAKGTISITKTGQRSTQPVAAAEYAVIADGDIHTLDGTLRAADGDVVATLVTNAQGIAVSVPLYLGSYIVRETVAPDGYLPDAQDHRVTLAYQDQHTALVEENLELTDTEITLEVIKRDAATDEPLAGAEFTLYRESAAGAGDWTVVDTLVSDAQGRVVLFPMIKGSYKLVETKAPDGYMLPSEAGMSDEQLFVVDDSSTSPLIELTFKDYAKPEPPLAKRDVDTNEPIGDTEFTLYRHPVTVEDGRVTTDVSTIAADGPSWAEVARVTTDAEGKAVLPELVFGYYQIKETRPNPAYASCEESGGEGKRCFVIDRDATSEVQVFYNEKIQLSCEIWQDTINVTSAGFKTDDEDYLRVENVGVESYHYTLDFRSTSNVRADEFTVVDPLESVATGNVRIEELFTPVARGDSDGRFNLWYRTNLTDYSQSYSAANAMDTNPFNVNNPEQRQMWPSVGWRLWREGLPATSTTHLSVKDLGLAAGEYITALRFEYGSVEVGFTTRDTAKQALQISKDLKPIFSDWSGTVHPEQPGETESQDMPRQPESGLYGILTEPPVLKPATYLVSCSSALLPPTIIRDSAVVNIARNAVLSDEDRDAVKTTVIEPFMMVTDSTPPTDVSTLADFGVPLAGLLPGTGDQTMAMVRILLFALLAAAGILLARGMYCSYLLRRQE
ncbi:MAG: hypothetical protein LBP24_04740 [Coriobacteriales bacterium]|nr:hypothetical protein [Coriobacteriales bacterium]